MVPLVCVCPGKAVILVGVVHTVRLGTVEVERREGVRDPVVVAAGAQQGGASGCRGRQRVI
jgi:hypothetical protein